ncbi:MAG: Na(+)/H(+) antiporter NhaA [marine bacterium B5-7]|nr:MAG: Na(+)/H(+) antiporter NhaA [marine bacterium B5-7]
MRSEEGYFAPWERAYLRMRTPFEEFLHQETTTGILLISCAIIALLIANSGFVEAYTHILHTPIALSIGSLQVEHSVHHWINDGLMTIFFFVVGLEIKREMLTGELSSLRNAMLPVIAAIGGMVVPALIYLALVGDGPARDGWGIPMATDIAFAVGVAALLGKRVPKSLLMFLVALAIVDDLGAVTVIAVFYTTDISFGYLGVAGIFVFLMVMLNMAGIRRPLPYFILTVCLWAAMQGSGVHATVAGVIAAWTIPAYTRYRPSQLGQALRFQLDRFESFNDDSKHLIDNPKQSAEAWHLHHTMLLGVSPLQRLETMLHVPSTYIVIPLFALANSAIALDLASIENAKADPAVIGIVAGLVVGKVIGVVIPVVIAWKLGLGSLGTGVTMRHLIGAGLLAGIGFTMSIFVTELAFVGQPGMIANAKMGILFASLVAGVAGYSWLRFVAPSARTQ